MIYLDTSALAKLVLGEEESSALEKWLRRHRRTVRASSDIARVELLRAVMRAEPTSLLRAQHIAARLHRVPLTLELLTHAAATQPPQLRSLDAIHLVSALRLKKRLTAFVAYDRRLIDAAEETGLPVLAPV